MTLCSAGLQVLVLKGRILPPGDTTIIPLNWNLRLPAGHFRLLMPLSQQIKKGVIVLAGLISSDHQEEIVLLFHNGSKAECIWNIRDFLGHLKGKLFLSLLTLLTPNVWIFHTKQF